MVAAWTLCVGTEFIHCDSSHNATNSQLLYWRSLKRRVAWSWSGVRGGGEASSGSAMVGYWLEVVTIYDRVAAEFMLHGAVCGWLVGKK